MAGTSPRTIPGRGLDYFVRQVGRAYDLFQQRAVSTGRSGNKRQRVRDHVLRQAPQVFRIANIRAALPGISDGTIRAALDDLRRDGLVGVDGPGRRATWTRG